MQFNGFNNKEQEFNQHDNLEARQKALGTRLPARSAVC